MSRLNVLKIWFGHQRVAAGLSVSPIYSVICYRTLILPVFARLDFFRMVKVRLYHICNLENHFFLKRLKSEIFQLYSGNCVPREKCPCGENEEFNECGGCEKSCWDPAVDCPDARLAM